MFLTLNEIAAVIQTKLNTIADTLYTAETITNKVVFRVVSSPKDYEKITEMELDTNENIQFTPILVKQVFSTMNEDFTQGVYEDGYLLEIYGYEKDHNDMQTIFDLFTYNENAVNWETISGWYIQKNTGKITYINTFTDTSGDNLPRVLYSMDLRWQYVLGGINQSNTTLSIGGSLIDYIGLSYTSDKIVLPNVSYGSSNVRPNGATGFTLRVTLPAQNVTANKNLFTDLASKTYNRSYAIILTIPNFATLTYNMVLKSGSMNFVRDQLISYDVVFEEALARTDIQINGVTLPIIQFAMERRNQVVSKTTDLEEKNISTGTSYIFTIRFGYDSTSTTSRDLLNAILTSNYLSTIYTLSMTVTSITPVAYLVMMINGKYDFESTGELTYECTFVARDVSVL